MLLAELTGMGVENEASTVPAEATGQVAETNLNDFSPRFINWRTGAGFTKAP